MKKPLQRADLIELRTKMLRPLEECELSEIQIESQFKKHIAGRFFLLRCHEKAFEYLFSLDSSVKGKVRLVQGLTCRFEQGRFHEEHSWVEIEDRIVFDGVLQKFYDKNCYRKKKCLNTPFEFSFNEAVALQELYGVAYFPDKARFMETLQSIRTTVDTATYG